MAFSLSCRDIGMADNFVARGNSKEEVMNRMMDHAKKQHNMSELDIDNMRMDMESQIKEE
jgi:predicted small metal-binding protein